MFVPLHVDFDHVFVKTEKADAKNSYKQAYGYFPGVVSIDGIIAYIVIGKKTAAHFQHAVVAECVAVIRILIPCRYLEHTLG